MTEHRKPETKISRRPFIEKGGGVSPISTGQPKIPPTATGVPKKPRKYLTPPITVVVLSPVAE